MKNLYLLSTAGLGQYYAIANDPTEAQNTLTNIFDDQDYGFIKDRRITKIEWLADAFKPDFREYEIT